MQMQERPRINLGPPQSYAEAVLRFPHEPFDSQKLLELRRLLQSSRLDELPIERRMVGISSESVKLIEKWSFKRDRKSVRKTGWDNLWDERRIKSFVGVLEADELYRELSVWTLKPKVENDRFVLVCVKAKPGFILPPPEYYLGFLTTEEYNLLVPAYPGLTGT